MSFQNILVPTDGSEFTKAAVAKAFDLAEVAGGRVTALYVKDKYATDESAKAAVGYVSEQGKARNIPVEYPPRSSQGSPESTTSSSWAPSEGPG